MRVTVGNLARLRLKEIRKQTPRLTSTRVSYTIAPGRAGIPMRKRKRGVFWDSIPFSFSFQTGLLWALLWTLMVCSDLYRLVCPPFCIRPCNSGYILAPTLLGALALVSFRKTFMKNSSVGNVFKAFSPFPLSRVEIPRRLACPVKCAC